MIAVGKMKTQKRERKKNSYIILFLNYINYEIKVSNHKCLFFLFDFQFKIDKSQEWHRFNSFLFAPFAVDHRITNYPLKIIT